MQVFKMKSKILFILVIVICGCFGSIFCDTNYDYYWRDYTGDVPEDAVEGGRDVNNRNTYIGQVFVKKYGIIPVTIYQGKTSVAANIDGIHHLSSYIKILCSSFKDNFSWVPADAATLHVKLINRHLVRGGVEWDGKVTNIGRIMYQGELLVAKVCGYNVGDAKLYFPAGNQEKTAKSYEVLVYDGPYLVNIIPRIV